MTDSLNSDRVIGCFGFVVFQAFSLRKLWSVHRDGVGKEECLIFFPHLNQKNSIFQSRYS